jgi:Skp family chaperone for outer membrane proteins
MKAATFVLAILISLLMMTQPGTSFAEQKFGRVSFIDIQKDSKKAIAAMEEIQKIQLDSQNKLTALRNDLTRIEEQLNKPDLPADQKAKLEKEIEEKGQEYQSEDQAVKVKSAIKQKSLQAALGQQIKTIIDKLAKDEGFTAIFRTELLVYSDGLIDVTEQITKALDAAPMLETK